MVRQNYVKEQKGCLIVNSRERQIAERIADFWEERDPYGFDDAFDNKEEAINAYRKLMHEENGLYDIIDELLNVAFELLEYY